MVQDERARHILYFGNGLAAKVMRIQHGILKDGLPMVRIRFMPSQDLMKFYDLKEQDKEDQVNGCFIKEYPEVYLRPMCDDPDNKCSMLLCDYFGQDTNMTFLKSQLANELKALQKMYYSLKYENAALHMQIRDLSQNIGKVIQHDADMLAPAISKLRGNSQEESGGEY